MIPEWLLNGDLPPGVHSATWSELDRRLGLLTETGCRLVYLDGSFVTTKMRPGDFDACWDIQHVDEGKLGRDWHSLRRVLSD